MRTLQRSSEKIGRQLQLARGAGVLLGPQLDQQLRHPAVDRSEAMEARVTPAAEGDQGRGTVGIFPPRPAMVDDQGLRSAADAAEPAVAAEDFFAAPGEAGAVAPAAVVAALTEPAAEEGGLPAGAAQRQLLEGVHGVAASDKSPTISSIIIGDFRLFYKAFPGVDRG